MSQQNLSSGFLIRSDTNQAVQPQKMVCLNFGVGKKGNCTIYVAKNKGTNKLCGYRTDLHLCFRICKEQV